MKIELCDLYPELAALGGGDKLGGVGVSTHFLGFPSDGGPVTGAPAPLGELRGCLTGLGGTLTGLVGILVKW